MNPARPWLAVILFSGIFITALPVFSADAAAGARAVVSPAKISIDVATIDRERILQAATVAMKMEPVTITTVRAKLSEGGANDFYSNGDYWWPNPDTADGLPYIQRDGETNPGNFVAHRQIIRQLGDAVAALGAGYKITGNDDYAKKAAQLLRVFFLDAGTRMNPNLQYAQAIPGVSPGRGTGIIDTLHLVEIPKAVEAMEKSPGFPPEVLAGLKKWFAGYTAWMTTSTNGKAEADAANNHAVAFWLQVAVFAQFTGDQAQLTECRRRFTEMFVSKQMAADGSFPLELARTKPYGYSIFQLDNMVTLCQVLSTPENDLWNFTLPDGRNIRKAVEFLYPFLADKSTWAHKPDVNAWDGWPAREPSLLFAGLAFNEQKYLELWKKLPADPKDEEVRRNIAITQPILWVNPPPAPPMPLPPEAQTAEGRGLAALREKNYLPAIQSFLEARKVAPNAPELFYQLGQAESNVPGRELRAIAWLSAYLAVNPGASSAAAIKEQIDGLEDKSRSNLAQLILAVQDATDKMPALKRDNFLSDVVDLWSGAGDLPEALKAAELIQGPDGLLIRGKVLQAMADAQVAAGNLAGTKEAWTTALKTAEMIQDAYTKSKAEIRIADAQAKAGDLAGAKVTLAAAFQAAELIQALTAKSKAEHDIVEAQANAGDFMGAKATWTAALDTAGRFDDAYSKSQARCDLVEIQVKAGDLIAAQATLATAFQSAELIQDPAAKLNLQQSLLETQPLIAEAQMKADDANGAQETWAAALKTAGQISDPAAKNRAQLAIAESQARAGDRTGAQKTAQLILPQADGKSLTQIQLAAVQTIAGDLAAAQETWSAALKTAAALPTAPAQNNARLAIVEARVDAGDLAGAQKTADLIQNAGLKSLARRHIADAGGNPEKKTAPGAVANLISAIGDPAPEVVPAVTVADWLDKLEDINTFHNCPLNSKPFLDLDAYVKALPSASDPDGIYANLRDPATRFLSAQNVVDEMLGQTRR